MIDRLARVLAAAFPELAGEELADALWLAAKHHGAAEPSIPETGPTGAQPRLTGRERDAHSIPVPDRTRTTADLGLRDGQPRPAAVPVVSATNVGLHIPAAAWPTPATVTALSLFRRVRRAGPPTVDIDATVEATADARRLVVVTRPAPERGLDVAIVVDRTPVATVWADAIAELAATLRRTGAFRTVTRWSLDEAETRPNDLALLDNAGSAHRTDFIIDPSGRRLVLLLTDGTARRWRSPRSWQALGRWAHTMPTVLVQLLPKSYWGYTATGRPSAVVRSRRPAGPNSTLEVTTSWWSDDNARVDVPVPIIAMYPDDIVRWSQAVVTGNTWTDSVWARRPELPSTAWSGEGLTAADRVRVFHTRASTGAQNLARVLAGAPLLSLPLIRVLHEHLVPQPETEQLAEVLVSGLLEKLSDGADGSTDLLRFRPGVAELLYEGTTASLEWDVFEVLTRYLARHVGSGDSVRAVLADPHGLTSADDDLLPFAALGREMAGRLGIELPEPAEERVEPVAAPAHTRAEPAIRGSSGILCVPGIVATESMAETAAAWVTALGKGLRGSGDQDNAQMLVDSGVSVAWYVDLLTGESTLDRDAREPDFERALLSHWLANAPATGHNQALLENGRTSPWPEVRTAIMNALVGIPEPDAYAARVHRYLTDPAVRAAAQERVAAMITNDTRVIVAHSFGAVVAYETLCAHPDWPVHTLITLGAPLGSPPVFERLEPLLSPGTPDSTPAGRWPGSVESWTDIVSRGDVVAAGLNLRSLFGEAIEMHVVAHGRSPHSAERYLASPVTGTAISTALWRGGGQARGAAPELTAPSPQEPPADETRHQVVARISEWLSNASDRRPLILTGDPGSARTTLLTYLTAASASASRRDAAAPDQSWPRGSAVALISAGGRSTFDVLDQLMEAFFLEPAGEDIPGNISLLLAEARKARHLPTLFIDGIDEAQDPINLITALLLPLIRDGRRQLRLLLATRRHLVPQLRQGGYVLLIDLDVLPIDLRHRVYIGGAGGMNVHHTICTVDIAGYGGLDRTRANYVALRAGMYGSVERAFDESGIPWAECFQQDVGDSILVLAPPTVPKGAFVGPLPRALAAAVHAHNETHPPEERLQLRLALHAGEITLDSYGFASPAIIHTSRLLNAQPLKDALARSPATLAMIVSDWYYVDVVRHHDEYEPDSYRRVDVDVKEISSIGWIRLPGHDLPAEPSASLRSAAPAPVQSTVLAPALRPASPQFYEVVDALESIPCMQGEHTRALVVDQLRFAGTIRYFASRRAHITSILRTCLDFEDGLAELFSVIREQEPPESIPLKRLVALLTGQS